MPDLGIFGWIIIGLLAGAIAGAFVPGRQRYGCLGTMAIASSVACSAASCGSTCSIRTRRPAGSARSSSQRSAPYS